MSPHEVGEQWRELRVIVEPAAVRGAQGSGSATRRPRVGKMTVDAEFRPALELRVDPVSGRARHEPERVAAQVIERAASLAGQLELASQGSQLVGGIERARAGCARQELRRGHDYLGGMTVPQRLQVRALTLP